MAGGVESTKVDAAVLGELVIDLIPAPRSDTGALFQACPGGAPGNVAAGLARLGIRSSMLSKVGPGAFGDLLIETLNGAGVVTSGVVRAKAEPTALAVVSLAANGERDFVLYRQGCADANFAEHELPVETLRACRLLHVGSLSLATPVSAAAQRRAIGCVREYGGIISADVNFRLALWRDLQAMRATGLEAVSQAHVVKVSDEELELLIGIRDIDAGAEALWHSSLKLLAVTRGADGATLFSPEHRVDVPGFPVQVVDTVGCGDAFMAALLSGVLTEGLDSLTPLQLRTLGGFACAAGAVVAGVSGAMTMMPRRADIEALQRAHENHEIRTVNPR
jgi:fructokinase